MAKISFLVPHVHKLGAWFVQMQTFADGGTSQLAELAKCSLGRLHFKDVPTRGGSPQWGHMGTEEGGQS